MSARLSIYLSVRLLSDVNMHSVSLSQQHHCSVLRGLTPLMCDIGCFLP